MATPAAAAAACLASPEAFEQLVGQLLQADNTSRKSAEAVFEEVKKAPDGCVQHLLRCLRASPSEENRAFSAIMLRKVLTRDEPTMFAAASAPVQVRGARGGRGGRGAPRSIADGRRPPAAAALPHGHGRAAALRCDCAGTRQRARVDAQHAPGAAAGPWAHPRPDRAPQRASRPPPNRPKPPEAAPTPWKPWHLLTPAHIACKYCNRPPSSQSCSRR